MKKNLADGKLLALVNEQAVSWQVYENTEYIWLKLNNTVQSVMAKVEPSRLMFPHQQLLASPLIAIANDARVLELGLGGGSNFRYFNQHYTELDYHIVELSSVVVELFKQYFCPSEANVQLHLQDAVQFISQSTDKYDLIISDLYCFQDSTIKVHNIDYLHSLAELLQASGFLYINMLPETRFDVELVKASLEQVGFEVIQAEKIERYINHVILAQKND